MADLSVNQAAPEATEAGTLAEPAGDDAPFLKKKKSRWNLDRAFFWNRIGGSSSSSDPMGLDDLEEGDLAELSGETTEMPPITSLSLSQLYELILSKNRQVQMQKTQWGIQQAEVGKARSIFEPELIGAVQFEDNRQKNSVEEAASRDFTTTYSERAWDYNAAVQGLLPSGAQFNVGYNLREESNTLTRTLTDEDKEYSMYLGATITQPLLKNAGSKATRAGIHMAEADADMAFQDYRQEMMRALGDGAVAYWNYYQAQEMLELREASLATAEKVLEDNRERSRLGKMAQTEVLESMAGVASRKGLLSAAQQERLDAMNKLRSMFSLAVTPDTGPFEAVEQPSLEQVAPDYRAVLRRAFELRPEYLAAKKRVERAGLKVFFTKNQSWPELDLKASYGLNGLDFSAGDAWDEMTDARFDSWSVGVELRMPLMGNGEGTNEVRKAALEKKRALLALKLVEVELANSVDTEVHKVANAAQQYEHALNVVDIHKQLLDAEMARLKAGKSNSRLVLEKEESYRKAREVALKNMVNLQMARHGLEMAGGTILADNGLEIMEVEL